MPSLNLEELRNKGQAFLSSEAGRTGAAAAIAGLGAAGVTALAANSVEAPGYDGESRRNRRRRILRNALSMGAVGALAGGAGREVVRRWDSIVPEELNPEPSGLAPLAATALTSTPTQYGAGAIAGGLATNKWLPGKSLSEPNTKTLAGLRANAQAVDTALEGDVAATRGNIQAALEKQKRARPMLRKFESQLSREFATRLKALQAFGITLPKDTASLRPSEMLSLLDEQFQAQRDLLRQQFRALDDKAQNDITQSKQNVRFAGRANADFRAANGPMDRWTADQKEAWRKLISAQQKAQTQRAKAFVDYKTKVLPARQQLDQLESAGRRAFAKVVGDPTNPGEAFESYGKRRNVLQQRNAILRDALGTDVDNLRAKLNVDLVPQGRVKALLKTMLAETDDPAKAQQKLQQLLSWARSATPEEKTIVSRVLQQAGLADVDALANRLAVQAGVVENSTGTAGRTRAGLYGLLDRSAMNPEDFGSDGRLKRLDMSTSRLPGGVKSRLQRLPKITPAMLRSSPALRWGAGGLAGLGAIAAARELPQQIRQTG